MKKLGFTLIELMVVMSIATILLTVAIPSYRQYIIRANLVEAFNALAAFNINMEQAFQDNANFGLNNNCAVNLPTATAFNFQCALSNNGQNYTIIATGNGNKGVTGYAFSIDAAGNRRTTAFPHATVPASCWLKTPGDC